LITEFFIFYSNIQRISPVVGQFTIDDVPSFLAGIFAFALFLLSLYAWFRRKQFSLLIVSFAFFIYSMKEMMELIPNQTDAINLIRNILDFVILVTFFIAIIIGPRIRKTKSV
jgi:hypothetical protein